MFILRVRLHPTKSLREVDEEFSKCIVGLFAEYG